MSALGRHLPPVARRKRAEAGDVRYRTNERVSDVKRTVTLEIAGIPYRLATDADEERIRGLAALVNERVAALGPRAQRMTNPAQLLAMVSLGLAEELVESEAKRRSQTQQTRDTVERTIARLDERLRKPER